MLACGQRSFEASNGWRFGSHALGNLSLGQAGIVPSLEQQIQEGAFFTLNAFDLSSNARPRHESLDDLLMGSHV